MKLLKGVKSFYVSHIVILVISIFLLVTFWGIASRSGIAFSTVTVIFYMMAAYSVGWNCGDRDGRKIPGFYPSKSFPFILAGLTSIIPLLLYAVRFLFPNLWYVDIPFINGEYQFFFSGNYLHGTMDLVYKIWYFPFISFMGNGNPILYLIPVLVQSLLIVIGYFVGTTRFRIMAYLYPKIVYNKQKEK